MHIRFLSWILIAGLAVSGAVSAFGAAAPGEATNPGRIVARQVVGNVYSTSKSTPGPRTLVSNNAPLTQDNIVSTDPGASVVLVFANGATISLGEDTELDIEQFTQDPTTVTFNFASDTVEPNRSNTRLRLNRGELVGKVATLRQAEGSSFTVNTPVGAAGIRGTTFRIVYRPAGNGQAFFQMTTLEGNVEVTVATGTVAVPISVTDNEEVVLADITVEVDDVTGAVTIVTATGTVPVVVATTADITTVAQIQQRVAQDIAQAVANVVIQPTGTGGTTGDSNTNEEPQRDPPPPTQTAPRTTTGDGRT